MLDNALNRKISTVQGSWYYSNNDLAPQYHISEIVSKAHRRANSILRCFATRDNDLFVRAFMVYVRPILEYNSVVWSPSLIRDIDQIEKVQRRFTKRLFGMRHFDI